MKTKILKTRFTKPVRFDVTPVALRELRDYELERLKNKLLLERLQATLDPEANAPLRRAANEAAAYAWTQPYPLLAFPALFEEKAKVALRQLERQRKITLQTAEVWRKAA